MTARAIMTIARMGALVAATTAALTCLGSPAAADASRPGSSRTDASRANTGRAELGMPSAGLSGASLPTTALPALHLPLGPTKAPPLPLSKKARLLQDKHATPRSSARERERWHAQLDQRIGKPPAPVVNIFNTWTHEMLPIERAADVPDQRRNRFFRCHFTGQPTSMDARLLDALLAAARHFDSMRIDIVSGFRAPKYNLMLRKKGREVARNSQHTLGSAIDFRLRGVPVRRLHAWARRLRLGGVGLYPASGFIHMDTGPVRYWNGR